MTSSNCAGRSVPPRGMDAGPRDADRQKLHRQNFIDQRNLLAPLMPGKVHPMSS